MKKSKLIIVTSRFPWPIDKGDKLRAFKLAYYLSPYFDVTVLAINESKSIPQITENLPFKIVSFYHSFIWKSIQLVSAVFNGKPFQAAYFFNPAIKKQIQNYFNESKPDYALFHLARTVMYLPENAKNTSVDLMDAFSIGMKRRAEKEKNPIKKWFFNIESNRMSRFETEILENFEKVSIISNYEKSILSISEKLKQKISVVPNGIDFKINQNQIITKKYDVLFVGNMHYPPNEKAALKIIYEIIPRIQNQNKNYRFLLAGAHADKFKRFENQHLSVQGWVENIQSIYLESKILLAPMEIGIGLQNKLLEAMICKLPVITTPLANEALQAQPGKEILIARNTEEMINCLDQLLPESELYHTISENSFQFVTENFNWQSIADTFVQYLQATKQHQ